MPARTPELEAILKRLSDAARLRARLKHQLTRSGTAVKLMETISDAARQAAKGTPLPTNRSQTDTFAAPPGHHPPPGDGWQYDEGHHHWHKPGTGETHPGTRDADAPASASDADDRAGVEADVAAAHPAAAKDRGLMGRIADRVLKAIDAAQLLAYRNLEAAQKVGALLAEMVDLPSDMAKLGYNPTTTSGTAGPQVLDPVKAAGLPVSGHVVASLAAKVLTKVIAAAAKKLAGTPRTMAAGDGLAGAVDLVAGILDAVHAEFGLAPCDRQAVRAWLAGLDAPPG